MEHSETGASAIETSLIAHPEAYDEWLVYADALSKAGDPRGELIAIGVALRRGQGDADTLRAREDALLQANAEAWFGKLASHTDWRDCFAWTLQTGYWGRIRCWKDYDHEHVDVSALLTYALAHPSAKFLRELDLGITDLEADEGYAPCIRALVEHGPMPSLRRMTIGDFQYPEESDISSVIVDDIGPLWPLLPKLEMLELQGAFIELRHPRSARLRKLVLHTGGLPGEAAESLAEAELPALEHLEVWFGTDEYGGTCNANHALGILQNPRFTKLEHLALANADFADELAAALAAQLRFPGLPPALRSLDLSMGTMTDAGAELLLPIAELLRRLGALDLSQNFLSPAMVSRLRLALPNARLDDQKQGEEGWYYVSVGE
ncbi:hypothetical protein G6O69_17225 [Pseudenhygromyxa sp. WMMC2535]|uniref:hypothetical protein n=1 Tax=Pseudenhygromyxa sp. WMMC2535 TaxID=2712867 RepID=UPI001554EFD3|nr:hypothetical protein [Pseudenhygromyxa sp. WMMC2535]NVB39587.1 hypothetical protein [Pseudenhygromyxa sp. WMMC2535]